MRRLPATTNGHGRKAKMSATGTRTCSWCGEAGHDKRSCDVSPNAGLAACAASTAMTSATVRASNSLAGIESQARKRAAQCESGQHFAIDDDRWAERPYGVEFDDDECNSRFGKNGFTSRQPCYTTCLSRRRRLATTSTMSTRGSIKSRSSAAALQPREFSVSPRTSIQAGRGHRRHMAHSDRSAQWQCRRGKPLSLLTPQSPGLT